jgi:hypothetical protein
MKKFMLTLVASFALVQSAQAITSNLNESINFINAITDSPLIQTVIPQSEFIVDIKRKSTDLAASEAIYEIKTIAAVVEDALSGSGSHHHHHQHTSTNKYIVKVLVTPNPQIGPEILTVESITPR